MLEPWDELLNLQRERQLCADDLEIIKMACAKDHGKNHVIQCPECWDRLLNRMRDRYLNSSAKEWFSGRRLFLQELDTMFSKARGGSLDFKTIEQRINDEKKEWYRDKVKNIGLLSAAKSTPEARRLQQTLNDNSLTIDELASELRGSISDNAPWNEAALECFLDRLKDAKSLQGRNEIYIDAFFQPSTGAHGAGQYEKYVGMVRNGTPIADVVNAMLRDRRSAQSEQDQQQRLQGKLDELKRAKAAHELSLAKKHKARQDRATAAAAAASDEQSQLAPCTVCLKTLDAQDFLACPVCQLLNEQYEQENEPVVYCSQTCHDSDYETHMKVMHSCASGPKCTNVNDADVEMDEDRRVPVFCRECVSTLKLPSVFCSPRCYDVNFQHHRDEIHLPGRKRKHSEIDDEGRLEFAAEDKTQYQARRIEEHLVTLDDAMDKYQQRTGATVS